VQGVSGQSFVEYNFNIPVTDEMVEAARVLPLHAWWQAFTYTVEYVIGSEAWGMKPASQTHTFNGKQRLAGNEYFGRAGDFVFSGWMSGW